MRNEVLRGANFRSVAQTLGTRRARVGKACSRTACPPIGAGDFGVAARSLRLRRAKSQGSGDARGAAALSEPVSRGSLHTWKLFLNRSTVRVDRAGEPWPATTSGPDKSSEWSSACCSSRG